jgi:excisionase family DNA binding protein
VSDGLVDADVIAELLAVPATWVQEHARAGNIPHYKLGRYTRFRVSEVLDWLDECRNAGRATALRIYHPAPRKPKPPHRANGRGRDTEGSAFDAPQS